MNSPGLFLTTFTSLFCLRPNAPLRLWQVSSHKLQAKAKIRGNLFWPLTLSDVVRCERFKNPKFTDSSVLNCCASLLLINNNYIRQTQTVCVRFCIRPNKSHSGPAATHKHAPTAEIHDDNHSIRDTESVCVSTYVPPSRQQPATHDASGSCKSPQTGLLLLLLLLRLCVYLWDYGCSASFHR